MNAKTGTVLLTGLLLEANISPGATVMRKVLVMTAHYELSDGLSFGLAFLFGIFFGLSLERSGPGDPRKLTGVFCLRDSSMPKVMFTAIIVAASAHYFLSDLGPLDLEQVYIIPT